MSKSAGQVRLGGIAAVLLGGALVCAAAPAAAQCPRPDARLAVEVRVGAAQVSYRNDLARAQIRALEQRTNATSRHNDQVLGLTVSTFEARVDPVVKLLRLSDGRVCLQIDRIDAVLTIPVMTVYVAADYKRGSCQYEIVLRHENEHVVLTQRLLRPYAERLRRVVHATVDRANPILGASERAVSDRLEALLKSALDRVMGELERERARVNATIDTPENYRRTNRRCREW